MPSKKMYRKNPEKYRVEAKYAMHVRYHQKEWDEAMVELCLNSRRYGMDINQNGYKSKMGGVDKMVKLMFEGRTISDFNHNKIKHKSDKNTYRTETNYDEYKKELRKSTDMPNIFLAIMGVFGYRPARPPCLDCNSKHKLVDNCYEFLCFDDNCPFYREYEGARRRCNRGD
jgi:hypothetical protein